MIITNSANKGVKCQLADFTVVFDPEKDISASLVLRTKTSLPVPEGAYNDIIGAGEYEISGNRVTGIQLPSEPGDKAISTAYVVLIDGMRVCNLGHINRDIGEVALDKLTDIDVLFVPSPTNEFDVKKIANLIKQVEPKIVIPLDDSNAQDLAKELGQKPEKMDKLVIKKKDIEEMNSKLIWLQRI